MGLAASTQSDAGLVTNKADNSLGYKQSSAGPINEGVEDVVLLKKQSVSGLAIKGSDKDVMHKQAERPSGTKDEEPGRKTSSEKEAEITEQLQTMLTWETEADVTDEMKTVLAEKLTKLLGHPETIIFEHEDDERWLFYRLIEELAWVDVESAFDFYIEWAMQKPYLRTVNLTDTETLKRNLASGAEFIGGINRKLKWDDRVSCLNPAVVLFPDFC